MSYKLNLFPWQGVTRNLQLSYKFQEKYNANLMREEFDRLINKFGSHNHHDVYHSGGWNALCLHAIDGRVDADWGGEGIYRKTEALNHAPYLEKVIDSFQCEKKRVRLLGLPPGERIYWHSDEGETFDSGTVRLHIPVVTNDGVSFQLSHENQTWKAGELWYGDFSFPHRLRNLGAETRIHLVLDLVVNDWVRGLFPLNIVEGKELRDSARSKCGSWYRYYNMYFTYKRYLRSAMRKPNRILPKCLELLGLKDE